MPSADAVEVTNGDGRGRCVLACEHASNFVPAEYGTLGLDPAEMERHIAWDPGALGVAQAMSRMLDAPLVASKISRLMIDCNRPPNAPDLIPALSETTRIPGNENLDQDERRRRTAMSYTPFHSTLGELIERRIRAGLETWLVTVHSFTPVYKGVTRPWPIGVIHDDDVRIARPLIEGLRAGLAAEVGVNQPYSPADRVYHTLERHARPRGIPCAMIEIRNDEIKGDEQQRNWAERLGDLLRHIVAEGGAPSERRGDQAAILNK